MEWLSIEDQNEENRKENGEQSEQKQNLKNDGVGK